MQHLTPGAHQFVDRFDHVYRDTDRAGLIRDGAGDRLTDPPCRIGREFVTAAIFEFINRLHKANVAFLNQIKELQPAVRVFLGDRNHQAQVCLDHFLFGLAGFFFALLHLLNNAAEFRDIQPDILADLRHVIAQFFDLVRRAFDEHLPATAGFFRHPFNPVGVEFVTTVFFDKFAPVDPGLIGQFHHRAVDLHDTAVDAIKLIDQGLDPVVMKVKFIHQQNDFRAKFLVFLFLFVRKAVVFVQSGADAAVLKFGQKHVVVGDVIQRFQHPRFERGFHRGQGHVGLFVIVIIVIADDWIAVGVQFGSVFLFGGRGDVGGFDDGGFILVHLVAKGGFKVDDIAQKNVFVQKFVAPDGDRLKGQRAFAQARNHRVAAGLDPFGDGNFAFARQQFDTAHFAQIHAHRIVCAIQLFRRPGPKRDFAVRCGFDNGGGFTVFVVGLFVLDDVDAHFGQHRHHVFDLFG